MTPEALERLEERVRILEDRVAIYEIITSYGMSVDAGARDEIGEIFGDDGVFDSSGNRHGRRELEDLAEMCGGLTHGFAHVTYAPLVVVEGDRASAVTFSNSLDQQGEEDDYRVRKLAANRWELERIDGRWQVRRRTGRVMTGSDEARSILARGVTESRAARSPKERP